MMTASWEMLLTDWVDAAGFQLERYARPRFDEDYLSFYRFVILSLDEDGLCLYVKLIFKLYFKGMNEKYWIATRLTLDDDIFSFTLVDEADSLKLTIWCANWFNIRAYILDGRQKYWVCSKPNVNLIPNTPNTQKCVHLCTLLLLPYFCTFEQPLNNDKDSDFWCWGRRFFTTF